MPTWAGLYLGAEAGGGFGNSNHVGDGPTFGPTTHGYRIAGGTAGYNLQAGPWVYGLEGDFAWADLRGQASEAGGRASLPLRAELALRRAVRAATAWSRCHAMNATRAEDRRACASSRERGRRMTAARVAPGSRTRGRSLATARVSGFRFARLRGARRRRTAASRRALPSFGCCARVGRRRMSAQ